MNLVCPKCQKRLTIEDRYAGMVVKCPACNGMLQAPVLISDAAVPKVAPPIMAPVVPPVPPLDPPPVSPVTFLPRELPPSALPPSVAAPAHAPAVMPEPLALPEPSAPLPRDLPDFAPAPATPAPVPPGDYSRRIRWHLQPHVLEWVTPFCLVTLFFLSFFSWYYSEGYGQNLWQLAFTERGFAMYTFYTVIFMFVALPLAVLTLCLEKNWIPRPVGLRPVWPWRSVIVGGVVALPFLFFLGDYISCHFRPFCNPTAIAMKLAFAVHFTAVIAAALQAWLEQRKTSNLPLPRIDLRW